MSTKQTTELRRELQELLRAVKEDGSHLDHLPNGRWPMIHNLAQAIEDLEAPK